MQEISTSAPASASWTWVERDGAAVVLLGQPAGVRRVRLATTISPAPSRDDGGHREAGHRAGTDDQHPLARERADRLGGVVQRDADQATGRRGRCRSRRATRLPTRSACWKSTLRAGPTVPASWPMPERLAGLAEDLALADDHRVQPGGDVEQVRDRAVVVVHVEVRHDVLGASPAQLARASGRPPRRCRGSGPRRRRPRPGCRSPARSPRVTCSQPETSCSSLSMPVGVQCQPLENGDRCGLVGDAHDQDAHAPTTPSNGRAASGNEARSTSDLRCSW